MKVSLFLSITLNIFGKLGSISFFKILSNLVTLIYMALDYGLPQDVERVMSPELESLLDSMLPPGEFSNSSITIYTKFLN